MHKRNRAPPQIIYCLKQGQLYELTDFSYPKVSLIAAGEANKEVELPLFRWISTGSHHLYCIDVEDKLWRMSTSQGKPMLLPKTPPMETVHSGETHSLAIDHGGNVWEFNDESPKKKGKKIFENGSIAACGRNYSIVVSSGQVFAKGKNEKGQLGLGDTRERLEFEKIATLENIIDVHCGLDYTVFLQDNGTVYGCGNNYMGSLGNPERPYEILEPTKLGVSNVKAVLATHTTCYFLTNEGELWCQGAIFNIRALKKPPVIEPRKVPLENVTELLHGTFGSSLFCKTEAEEVYSVCYGIRKEEACVTVFSEDFWQYLACPRNIASQVE